MKYAIKITVTSTAVSYTHLDVYKRQDRDNIIIKIDIELTIQALLI